MNYITIIVLIFALLGSLDRVFGSHLAYTMANDSSHNKGAVYGSLFFTKNREKY